MRGHTHDVSNKDIYVKKKMFGKPRKDKIENKRIRKNLGITLIEDKI